ncbi:hypothetical protein JCM1841_002875 [Sporobolomyces salmonicolor]
MFLPRWLILDAWMTLLGAISPAAAPGFPQPTHKAASPFCDASALVPDLLVVDECSVPPGQVTVAIHLARGTQASLHSPPPSSLRPADLPSLTSVQFPSTTYAGSFSTCISTRALALHYDIACLAPSLAPTAMNSMTGSNLSLLPPLPSLSLFDPFFPYPCCIPYCNLSTIIVDLVGQYYYIHIANTASNGNAIQPFFTLLGRGYGNVTGDIGSSYGLSPFEQDDFFPESNSNSKSLSASDSAAAKADTLNKDDEANKNLDFANVHFSDVNYDSTTLKDNEQESDNLKQADSDQDQANKLQEKEGEDGEEY